MSCDALSKTVQYFVQDRPNNWIRIRIIDKIIYKNNTTDSLMTEIDNFNNGPSKVYP